MADLVQSVNVQGLEGLVTKRRDSRNEPGLRSGAWQKMRVSLGQEFVIGGYTIGGATFDALVFGYCEGKDLNIYSAHAERVYAQAACRTDEEVQTAGNREMPARKPAGNALGAMGRRADGKENGGLSVVETDTGRSI